MATLAPHCRLCGGVSRRSHADHVSAVYDATRESSPRDRSSGVHGASNLSPEAEDRAIGPTASGLDPNMPVTAGAEYADNYVSVADREHRLANMPPEQKLLAELELRMEQSYGQFMAESERTGVIGRAAISRRRDGRARGPKNDPLFHRRPADHEPSEAALRHADRPGESRQYRRLPGRRRRLAHPQQGGRARSERDLGRCTGLGDSARGDGPYTKEMERQEQMLSSRPTAVLGRLAKETGGFLLENTNDLGAGCRADEARTHDLLSAGVPIHQQRARRHVSKAA